MSDERRFYEGPAAGARRSAPAAIRNREPIAEVLSEWLPDRGLVLEIASGTGEHAVHFAGRFPNLDWQPSDLHPDALSSIRAWREAAGLRNLREPLILDAAAPLWPVEAADAVRAYRHGLRTRAVDFVGRPMWPALRALLDTAASRRGTQLVASTEAIFLG